MSAPDDQPRFDPRHDPIFQRGYRPDAGPRPTARQPEFTRQPEPAPTRTPDGAQPGAHAFGAAEPGDVRVVGDPAAVGETPRNPYFLALWITAVVLIVAGVALEWRSVALADYGYSSPGQVSIEAIIQQLTWVIAPILITVGLSTIIALLFWQAIHWTSPRPGQTRPEATERRQAGDKTAPWRLGRWS